MARKCEPFTLFIRKPQKIYYVRYAGEKTRTAHSTGKTSKSEAMKYALSQLKIRGELEFEALVTLGKFTEDFFIDGKCHWLESKEKKGKEQSKDIIQQHRGRLMNHIYPQYSERILTSITAIEIDNWLVKINRANKTKNNILDTMKLIWGEAIKAGIISVNIIEHIERYKVVSKSRSALTKKEIFKLFPNNIDSILYVWENMKYASLLIVLTTTGMRVGEALALNWGDIKKDKSGIRYLEVSKAQKKIDMSIGTVKNKIPRICPLLDQTNTLLEEWHCITEFSKQTDLIFPNESGALLQQSQVLKQFKRALKKTEINTEGRNLVVHSLRHTFNTHFRPILPDDILRKFTGHSDAKMTDLYDHPDLTTMAKSLLPYQKPMNEQWGKFFSS